MAATASTIWYFSDWLAEPGLRLCGLAAKGLWMDMLAIASTSDEPGFVLIGGEPADAALLARFCGASLGEVEGALGELEKRKVFSRDAKGRIYCRRMIRHQRLSQRGSSGGRAAAEANQRDEKGKFKQAGKTPRPTTTSTTTSPSSVKDSPVGESSKPAAPPAGTQPQFALEAPLTKSKSELAMELYNSCALALSWVSCARLTPARRKSLEARLKELGTDGWSAMLEKAASLRFFDCRRPREGKHANWRPSLEFFLSSQKAAKIMEGFYDRYGQSTESLHQLTGGARLAALASLGSLDS